MIHAESNRPNCIISSTRLESFLRAVPRRESEYAASPGDWACLRNVGLSWPRAIPVNSTFFLSTRLAPCGPAAYWCRGLPAGPGLRRSGGKPGPAVVIALLGAYGVTVTEPSIHRWSRQ